MSKGKDPHDYLEDYRGTQAAANPALRMMIEAMKDQLLIVLINRLGGDIRIPVSEIDGTGDKIMSMQFNQEKKEFRFVVTRKS